MPSSTRSRALVSLTGGRGAVLLTLLGALLALSACARPAPTGQPMAVSFLPAPGEFLTSAGDPLDAAGLRKRASTAAYVLVGESHGNACDHEAEARVLTVLAHGPNPPAVGLEMAPRAKTPVLRDFVAGKIPLDELEARLDWAKTWGHPFARYRPVFQALRDWKLPAAGLNVQPGVIRRLSAAAQNATLPEAASSGAPAPTPVIDQEAFAAAALALLAPEDRAQLPARLIAPAPEQLAFLREAMAGHPEAGGGGKPGAAKHADPRQEARFLLIQSAWDTAMAGAAVELRRQTGRPVAVLAGTGHVDGGLGIARRLKALDPGAEILLVSPWRGDEFDAADADVRVYCPLSFESRMGMTLMTRPDGDGFVVVVGRVVRGGRAEAAGLRPGDVVERAGRWRMASLNALHLAGGDAFREKSHLELTVRRGSARYTVDLGPLGQPKTAAPGAPAGSTGSGKP